MSVNSSVCRSLAARNRGSALALRAAMLRITSLILAATLLSSPAAGIDTSPDPQRLQRTPATPGLSLDREIFLVRTGPSILYGGAAIMRFFSILRVRVAVVFRIGVQSFPTVRVLTESDPAGSRPLEPLVVKLRNGFSWTT